MATGAMIEEVRGTGGSGGNSTSGGPLVRGYTQSMTLRLTKNEAAITPIASRIIFRRIVPPDRLRRGVYRGPVAGARAGSKFNLWRSSLLGTGGSRSPDG